MSTTNSRIIISNKLPKATGNKIFDYHKHADVYIFRDQETFYFLYHGLTLGLFFNLILLFNKFNSEM